MSHQLHESKSRKLKLTCFGCAWQYLYLTQYLHTYHPHIFWERLCYIIIFWWIEHQTKKHVIFKCHISLVDYICTNLSICLFFIWKNDFSLFLKSEGMVRISKIFSYVMDAWKMKHISNTLYFGFAVRYWYCQSKIYGGSITIKCNLTTIKYIIRGFSNNTYFICS